MEQVSAFSAYAVKNRNAKQLLSKKKQRNAQRMSNRKSKKQKNVGQMKSANQQKGTVLLRGTKTKTALLKGLFTNLTLYLLQET